MDIKKRTIMIFPEFDNMGLINNLREKYDPLAHKVKPHITLVFPFESDFLSKDLIEILSYRLSEIKPFYLELEKLSVYDSWLFLNIKIGSEEIKEIHNKLYDNEFSLYKPCWLKNYYPHMTIGHFKHIETAQKVYNKEKGFDGCFCGSVNKVSIEIIGRSEESIIETEYYLK